MPSVAARAAVLAAVLISAAHDAGACSIRGYAVFDLEPLAGRVASDPPAALSVASIERGRRTPDPGMDCGDAGILEFSVDRADGVGYVLESVGGNLPEGLFPELAVIPRGASSSSISFPWRDYPRLPADHLRGAVRVLVLNARGQAIDDYVIEVDERDPGI